MKKNDVLKKGSVLPLSPAPDRETYLPEDYYFALEEGFTPERREEVNTLLKRAAPVTEGCVAQWAERYVAYPLGHEGIPPEEWQRAGALPTDERARAALIAGLFAWFEHLSIELLLAAVDLYQGEEPLLYQHDGMPGWMHLTAGEFAQVQAAWEQEGLPRDLYYPAREQRIVIEPVEQHGGVVLGKRRYSPRLWEQRDEAAIARLRMPSEAEREKAFNDAYWQFTLAMLRRLAELREPGQSRDAEYQRIARLLRDVFQAWRRAHDLEAPGTGEADHPTAGR